MGKQTALSEGGSNDNEKCRLFFFFNALASWRLSYFSMLFVNNGPKSRIGNCCGSRGWILVDSLIGVTILVTALLAIMLFYTQITSSTVAAKEYQNAVYIAQQHLDNLRQYDGTDILKNCPAILAPPVQVVENVTYTIQFFEKAKIPLTEALDAKVCPYKVLITWPDPKISGSTRSIEVVNYYYTN